MSEPRIRKRIRATPHATQRNLALRDASTTDSQAPANVTNTPRRNCQAFLRPATWRAWLMRNHPTTRTGWVLLTLATSAVALVGIGFYGMSNGISTYPLLSYLPLGLAGGCLWLAGVVQLIRADLKIPQWSNEAVPTSSYAGYALIVGGGSG